MAKPLKCCQLPFSLLNHLLEAQGAHRALLHWVGAGMSCPAVIWDHCQVPFTATFASTLAAPSATLVVFQGRGLLGAKKSPR